MCEKKGSFVAKANKEKIWHIFSLLGTKIADSPEVQEFRILRVLKLLIRPKSGKHI